jgi:hypothetical protein
MMQEKTTRVTFGDQDRHSARAAPVWQPVLRRDPGCNYTLLICWGI